MPDKFKLIWKIPLAITGVFLGLLLLLLIAAAWGVSSPTVRQKSLQKGVAIANEKTDYDIDLGRLYLSPFHHSPKALLRAYKGQEDLPVEVSIDSLFVGHRGVDTLVYVHALRLAAVARTKGHPLMQPGDSAEQKLVIPAITVDTLDLTDVTFHSDSLIKAVGVDAIVGRLATSSPEISIPEGRYPLHGLKLKDVFCGIDLRGPKEPVAPDTIAKKPLALCFDLPDGELRNVHFRLTPLGMDIKTASLDANALVDVGANCYDARRLDVGGFEFDLGKLRIPADTIYGAACADIAHSLITSDGLHVRSDEIGAKADLHTTQMNLNSMQVQTTGNALFRGSKASLRASYDIKREAYDATVHVDKVDLSPFLKDSTRIILAGDIDAKGKGVNPAKPMRSKVKMHLTDAVYGGIDVSGLELDAALDEGVLDGTLCLPVDMQQEDLKLRARTDHRFRVSQFMTRGKLTPEQMGVDYHTRMRSVYAHVGGRTFRIDTLALDFATDSTTSLALQAPGLSTGIQSPMHVLKLVNAIPPLLQAARDSATLASIVSLQDLTQIDTLRRLIPALSADITLQKGSPLQAFIDSAGVDINDAALALRSDSAQTRLTLSATTNDRTHIADTLKALRLPKARAAVDLQMSEGVTTASVDAAAKMTDGLMTVHGLKTDADLWLDLKRTGNELNGVGCLTADELSYDSLVLGSRTVDLAISPSPKYAHALKADVHLDDIPLDLVDSILRMQDIDLSGVVRAQASVDGLPKKMDLSANVLPIDVAALYKPYGVGMSLGRTPIIMEHNKLDFNGLPIYGADSTFLALKGGVDLDRNRLDIVLEADSFAPVKLVKDGPIPVYGDLATDIHGTVSGPLDSIVADVDVTLLPTTDITYPIDKKNLAQVKPHGKVNIRYNTADTTANALSLGGRVNVDDGMVKYSPKAYPVMPFKVDSGSHIAFNGPIGKTQLHVSASQKVKADVDSKAGGARRVNFNTGVRVNGEVDSIGIKSIGFFLEAPGDEAVSKELASADEGTREGLAAMLLTTGMYLGQSNEAAQREGYALSSIVNSRINAAIANSKVGKFMDVDFSSGKKNDMNITLSKSFFKNKLRITIGSTISDNPEVNEKKGLISSVSADYKLTKEGNVSLRLYSRRDKNNVLEGELYKAGLGVRATKSWRRWETYLGDTISRTHSLTADAGIAYRTNNSLGPDASLKYALKNVLGNGEIFTVKGNGAYYWALRNRHPGDPKKTDTYKLGVNAALVFPYLHWAGDNNPDGDTKYMMGYQYENIAGGYGVHKLSGSFTYFFHSSNSPYITHAFTPFSLSVVMMKAESADLLDKAAEYPSLIKVIAGDEFVPSIGYNFTYNDYRAKRAVNTMFDFGVKESGNLINALYCAFGHKWNEQYKPLGKISFNQFVKVSLELRNRFNFTEKVSLATRLFAGANIPLGNSTFAPLSEAFYAGGPNGMRAASPYAYGPGNFFSAKYNQNFFHAGDVKLEANVELRFPIVWKLYGAAFVDAGNVWNWYSTVDLYKAAGFEDYLTRLQIPETLLDGLYNNPDFAKQIALGTGAGLRLDIEGLVIRLDLGVAIHAPYQTFKYDKEGKPDKTQPITTYFNIPSALDAMRLNFGIGYPF